MSINNNNNNLSNNKQYCILFYKYHPLTDDKEVLETYRHATEVLCKSLNLTGRILIGLSNNGEGINGTLAGSKDDLNAYVNCMLNNDVDVDTDTTNDVDCKRRKDAVTAFHNASKEFFAKLNIPQLFLESPNDFKWSSWSGQGEGDDLLGVCPGGKRGDSIDRKSTSSSVKNNESWFPDLHIKIVKEIISSGGAFKDISTQDTSVGYLTPKEWHEEMKSLIEKNKKMEDSAGGDANGDEEVETVLIDVRNHKECQIGNFAPGISIDPHTKTFSQFPKWVKENADLSATDTTASPNPSLLTNKRILMYCTGGIRCEKASAYIRQTVPNNKGIYHLKGGIHKYLEEFGGGQDASECKDNQDEKTSNTDECLFVGKNFVFDRRGALDAKGHGINNNRKLSDSSNQVDGVVGTCQYCGDPYDVFHPDIVCCVCREPILTCSKCQRELSEKQRQLRGLAPLRDGDNTKDIACRTEYHCEVHFHLKSCYFTSLIGLSKSELEQQLQQLQSYHKELEGTGKKGKQKRRTLRKQIEKIQTYMKQPSNSNELVSSENAMKCRHCGTLECNSDCWGFHGGNKRMENNQDKDVEDTLKSHNNKVELKRQKRRKDRLPSNQRPAKLAKRGNDLSEIKLLQLCNTPSHNRNDSTGMRVPPPVVRVLQSGVKGKWVGKTVKWLFNNEFGESMHGLTQRDRDERLEQLIREGLIRINGVAVKSSNVLLRNMDTIEHIVQWHEPPVLVPSKIEVLKHALPESILPTDNNNTTTPLVYCINKPSSVPVYPSGPYYANSLLLMVEAQEGLTAKTLIPLHRIDRATSGVLLCANMSSVAKVIQGRMSSNSKEDDDEHPPVRKLYLARVKGKFPSSSSEGLVTIRHASFASACWHGDILEVDAPIAVDLGSSIKESESSSSNSTMHRSIRSDGKQSISRFKLIAYDEALDQSLVSCAPITGRKVRVCIVLSMHM